MTRCAVLVCVALASCSQITGLSDYSIGAIGGHDDASAPTDDAGAGIDPILYVQLGQEGGFDSAALGADADSKEDAETDASQDVQLAQDGGVGSDATFGAGADAGVDAANDADPDAGPVLTFSPSDAALSILTADAGVCSLSGTQSASLHLLNMRDAGVALLWVGFAPPCAETSYGDVAPGASHDVATYVTHVWRIKNQSDGQFITEFRLDSPASYSVTVY